MNDRLYIQPQRRATVAQRPNCLNATTLYASVSKPSANIYIHLHSFYKVFTDPSLLKTYVWLNKANLLFSRKLAK